MSREIVDQWFGAFDKRDISILDKILADDFVHTSPYGKVGGKKTYLDMVRANSEAFFSPQIQILDVIEGKDKVAVRYLVNTMRACEFIYVKNGQITEIQAYYHVGEKPSF